MDVRAAEFECFFVGVVGDDDVVSASDEGEDGGDDGGHAGAEDDAVLCVFEVGESLFGDFFGGVAVSAVLVAVFALAGVGFYFFGVFEDVGGGLYDRGGDGVGVALSVFAGVDGAGGEAFALGSFFGIWGVGHGWALLDVE